MKLYPVRAIRKKMVNIMQREISNTDLKGLVNKLIPDSIGQDIEKACQGIFPLHDVYIRKVKILRKPKFDLGKLMDLHGEVSGAKKEGTGEGGEKVDRPEGYEPPVMETV